MIKRRSIATRIRYRLRPVLLAAVVILVILQIVVLSPGSLENPPTEANVTGALEPTEIIAALAEGPTLAPGIPTNQIPDYSIRGFDYISSKGGIRQWKLLAKTANQFNSNQLVHARQIVAYLYNPGDEPTVVQASEAKYFLDQKDLEVYGKVKTTFPDGFTVYSEYLHYRPTERLIDIPKSYAVRGVGADDDEKQMTFTSRGMEYEMNRSRVILPRNVEMTMKRLGPKQAHSQGVADHTTIRSDHCEIDRNEQTAKFRMSASRPTEQRFVKIEQPDLKMRSRTVDLNYGAFDKVLRYLTAYDDVYIEENENDLYRRYATCGQSDFDTTKDLIVLTKFPQVYQDNDTVTGQVILIHRDRDIVEVEHSNAFSEGKRSDYQ